MYYNSVSFLNFYYLLDFMKFQIKCSDLVRPCWLVLLILTFRVKLKLFNFYYILHLVDV